MIKEFMLTDKLGDIVTVFPQAIKIFNGYNIDYCCGGNRPLSEAVLEGKLDSTKILYELNSNYKEFLNKNEVYTDWAKEKPGNLMEYIIGKHHAYLKEELPWLSELIFKILKVHGRKHEELFLVHKYFNNLRTELEEHLVKEEEFLYPLIKKYEADGNDGNREKVIRLISELEGEHTGAGDLIKELREITNHYTVPKDGCKTFELTYKKLTEFEEDLFEHIHLENNILFKDGAFKN